MKKITLFTVALIAAIIIPLTAYGSIHTVNTFEQPYNIVRYSPGNGHILTDTSPTGRYIAVKAETVTYFKKISANPYN